MFQKQSLLVTDAAQRIGLTTALEYAKAGAKVVLADVVEMLLQVGNFMLRLALC